MRLNDRLKRYLDQEQGAYEIIPHREVFSSREVAAESHVTDRQLAKVLAVREEDDGHLMVVLPAACRLDLNALRHATGRHRLSFVSEDDMGRLFPDCEIGAMPPFGQLYEMPVYLDACFSRAQTIVFRAGNHHEVVRMPYVEYERLVKPVVGEFCTHVREKDLTA
ncbi:MAG TPA: YbaK/EbsC family protein [Candidatus Methylomirabilis sp.]|jgi:Ala-tRNA(Pro) deacylase|nr:YbaK/EbsC family protein [Candidatus Methylomirabilis sp.]